MTQKEFFEELGKIDGWVREEWGVRRSLKVGHFCPITAVVYRKTKKRFPTCQWDEAARIINLPKATARKIANAADFEGDEKLIKRVLKTCKISGETCSI